MRRFLVATAAAALVLAPAAASAQSGDAEVVAVHGIPQSVFDTLGADSTSVDVYAAGSYGAPLTTFEFGDTGTLNVPAGTYTLEVYPAGADPEAGDPVISLADAELAAGSSTSVVAQLDEAGTAPSLTAYPNQTDDTGIQVFHTAAFGAVDIVAGGEVALEGVTNGQTARVDVPGGTTVPSVGVAPTGEDVAIDLGDVEVPEDTLVLAFAIGSAEDGSLDVATSAVGAQAADDGADDGAAGDDETEETPVPSHVAAGTAGLADSSGSSTAMLLLFAAGLLLLGAPVSATVRSRR
ncbi:DUF4397 domain-containing protein [Nitriliruptor alkaliphilus]|uniref:DUF4397 domain-containing protein n=1 Tax=Nitriliruptor alkaliphilus TaxID=427918 RepID=UPI000696411B|nr:DUF4397 domain-containing protein [Nitriliruptor alkaliphilus]